MKPGRNEKCWCGSGLKYKHCHYHLDDSVGVEHLRAAQNLYVNKWETNAANYQSQGCYDWLASLLHDYSPTSLLDIGCGEGSHLLSVLRKFGSESLKIVSLDENPLCLEKARNKLQDEGFSPSVVYRMKRTDVHEKVYQVEPVAGKLVDVSRLMLVEGDVLIDDKELSSFLEFQKFDAVTVWMVGTHLARQYCANLSRYKISGDGIYRLFVQNRVYEIADAVLNPGGTLHVVDRTEKIDDSMIDEIKRSHAEQASVTDLVVERVESIPYSEVFSNYRISMKPTPGTSGRVGDMNSTALTAVISRKPRL